jgi:hypothetical protein
VTDPEREFFDHLRNDDGEHVGYIEITADGEFVPFDLLHRPCGGPMDLGEAEEVLDGIGLRMLAEDWWLHGEAVGVGGGGPLKVRIREVRRDHVVVNPAIDDGPIAKAVDLTRDIVLLLPTDRLRQAGE